MNSAKNPARAAILRTQIEAMEPQISKLRNNAIALSSPLHPKHKAALVVKGKYLYLLRLKAILEALAGGFESGQIPELLQKISDKKDVVFILRQHKTKSLFFDRGVNPKNFDKLGYKGDEIIAAQDLLKSLATLPSEAASGQSDAIS